MSAKTAFRAVVRLELLLLLQNRAFVALTMLAAVSFLALVSLFGLTASDAPMALIVDDQGPYARPFVESLVSVPHAFRLMRRTRDEANAELLRGHLAGAITLPANFSAEIARGNTVAIEVDVDNVNVDLVADLQRAIPAAIVHFGGVAGFPGLRVSLREHDVWNKDTNFLPYITVSGLALSALIIAGVLGAMAVAREWEAGTVKLLLLSPASLSALVAGKIASAILVSLTALAITTAVVVIGYGAVPMFPAAAALGIALSVVTFACLGAWLGSFVRRTLVLVPFLFGIAMPLFIDSGALEPTRFDGERIWYLSHLTPLYYAVGYLQWAFFGLRITPEPVAVDLLVLVALAVVGFLAAAHSFKTRGWRRSG